MQIPVLMVLVFALWTMILLVLTVGIYRWGSVFARKAQLTDFPADDVQGPDFYKRAMRAHANCVENLPVFVAVVFAAYVVGVVNSEMVSLLSIIAVGARVLQSLIHVSVKQSNTVILIRFSFFLLQLACFFGIAAIVLLEVL